MMMQQPPMPMQQPPMMMAPQVPMMPSTTSAGTVPMAITQDPQIQCHVQGCLYVGNGRCHWTNLVCRKQKSGGCKKRYCHLHKYEKSQTVHGKHQTYTAIHQCCQDCGEQLEADFITNRKGACIALITCLCLNIGILFLPMIFIFTSTPESHNSYRSSRYY